MNKVVTFSLFFCLSFFCANVGCDTPNFAGDEGFRGIPYFICREGGCWAEHSSHAWCDSCRGRCKRYCDSEFHHAAAMGDVAACKEFLQKGYHVDVKYSVVVEHGLGKDFGYEDYGDHSTPLGVAALEGRLEVVRFLLGHGAGVNEQNKYGETPLHMVLRQGFRDWLLETRFELSKPCASIVTLLIENGADVNMENSYGEKPLDVACMNFREGSKKVLSEHGAVSSVMLCDDEVDIDWR